MNQDLPIRRPGDTPRKQCGRQTLYLYGDGVYRALGPTMWAYRRKAAQS